MVLEELRGHRGRCSGLLHHWLLLLLSAKILQIADEDGVVNVLYQGALGLFNSFGSMTPLASGAER
jgi:hypothetical protein